MERIKGGMDKKETEGGTKDKRCNKVQKRKVGQMQGCKSKF